MQKQKVCKVNISAHTGLTEPRLQRQGTPCMTVNVSSVMKTKAEQGTMYLHFDCRLLKLEE